MSTDPPPTQEPSAPFPGEEVFDAEHPIKHVFYEVPGARRLAVVFSGFEKVYQPKYNYIGRFAELATHRLHVLDDMGTRGCYYLGRNRDFFVAEDIARLVDERLAQVGLTRADVVCVGSSKGATAALYHALTFGYGSVLAAAPQTYLAKYLRETVQALDVSSIIAGGDEPEDREFLDSFLFETARKSSHRPRLRFFISPDDSHYEIHLQPFLDVLDAHGYEHEVTFGEYPNHSAVGPPFSTWVLQTLGTRSQRDQSSVAQGANRRPAFVSTGAELTDELAEEYERLLYKGAYLIHETRTPPAPRAEDLARRMDAWRAETVGRYTVRFDETWEAWRGRAGDADILLIGTVTHVDRPQLGSDEVVADLARALLHSWELFHEALDFLSGSHVILARSGDRHVVVQDATGMEAVTYDHTAPVRLLSSHPGLIAELQGYELSDTARWWFAHPKLQAGGVYFPGLITQYDQIRHLTPNTQLDLDTLAVQRFFPRSPLEMLDLDDIVASSATWLRNQWQWLVERHPVSVSLTAGLDSRLTFAASRDVADRLHFFTYTVWGNRSHEEDCVIGRTMAERFGLEHDIYRIKRGEPVLPPLEANWDRMYGGMRGGLVLANAYLTRLPAGHLHVRSNVLETVRGFYLKNKANVPDRFDTAKLSRLFRAAAAAEFEPHFKEFVELTDFTRRGKLNYHYSDLYYWEHRMGAWHSGVVRSSKPSHNTFIIYNNRRFLTTMLSLPLEDRAKAINVWELMAAMWPEVLEQPIMSGSAPSARPERTPVLQQPDPAGAAVPAVRPAT